MDPIILFRICAASVLSLFFMVLTWKIKPWRVYRKMGLSPGRRLSALDIISFLLIAIPLFDPVFLSEYLWFTMLIVLANPIVGIVLFLSDADFRKNPSMTYPYPHVQKILFKLELGLIWFVIAFLFIGLLAVKFRG